MAYSRVVLEGDGVTTDFAVNFALDFLLEADVTCRVGTEVDGLGDPVYRTITFLDTNLLSVGGAVVADGVAIVFERTVDKDTLRVDFNNGDTLDEDNLMTAQKQTMMAVHEVLDGRFAPLTQDIDASGYSVINLREPVADADAATKEYVDDEVAGTLVASDAAVAAADAAVAAAAAAQAAMTSATNTVDAFEDMFLGVKTTTPGLDNDGSALQEGASFYLKGQTPASLNGLYFRIAGDWVNASSIPGAFYSRENFFPVAAQTVIPVSGGFSVGDVAFVYVNGVSCKIGTNLGPGSTQDDVNISSGTSLVFASGFLGSEWVQLVKARAHGATEIPLASDISFAPTGTIASSTVQGAVAEVAIDAAAATAAVAVTAADATATAVTDAATALSTATGLLVPKSRVLTAAGLVTGGGDLTADRTFTVTKATGAEVITGTDDTKAVTPLGNKAALDAAIAAIGAGTLVKLSGGVTTVSAALALDLGTTYRRLIVKVRDMEPVTDGGILQLRAAVDGIPTFISTGTPYKYAGTIHETGVSTYQALNSAGANELTLSVGQVFAAGNPQELVLEINISGPGRYSTFRWAVQHSKVTSGNYVNVTGAGTLINPWTWTHVQLFYSTGNIAAGATYTVYGLVE